MRRFSQWFDIGPHASGRTTAIVQACKSIGATMLCATETHAIQVREEHDVKAMSIQSGGIGMPGPFLADHYAMQYIAHHYEETIQSMQVDMAKLDERLRKQAVVMDKLRSSRDDWKTFYHELKAKEDE